MSSTLTTPPLWSALPDVQADDRTPREREPQRPVRNLEEEISPSPLRFCPSPCGVPIMNAAKLCRSCELDRIMLEAMHKHGFVVAVGVTAIATAMKLTFAGHARLASYNEALKVGAKASAIKGGAWCLVPMRKVR